MKKHRISDIITLVLFLGIIFGFTTAFVVMPDSDKNSFQTGLQRFPDASNTQNKYTGADFFIHGELADQFDEYFCDQFPLRRQFVSVKALTEFATFRGVNNGVLYSKGQYATVRFNCLYPVGDDYTVPYGNKQTKIVNTDIYSEEHVKNMTDSIKAELEKLSVPVKVMLPPRTIDVVGPKIGHPTTIGDRLNAQVKDALGSYYIDVLPVLREMGEQYVVYYRTDHHWTSVGAFYAYDEIVKSFGDTTYDFESFDFETVYGDFCGTSYRNGNFFFNDSGEEIQLVKYDGYDKLKVELGDNLNAMKEMNGMYDTSALYGSDPYNVYLHGKTKYVRITMPDDAERETLLVVKDSFAHSLVPILARNYNVVMVDIDLIINPELGNKIDLSYLVKQADADKVLLLYNLQNVIENDNLSRIVASGTAK